MMVALRKHEIKFRYVQTAWGWRLLGNTLYSHKNNESSLKFIYIECAVPPK